MVAWCALAAGPGELALHLAVAARSPGDDDWARARGGVEAWRREGDLVVASPRWAEPHARRAFGEALMPLRDVARPDEAGYARAIEVAARGARDGAFAGWEPLAERDEGRLTLRLWGNPSPERYAFDVVDAVEAGRADVSWEGDGEVEALACDFVEAGVDAPYGQPALPSRRYACGGEARQSVAVTVVDDVDHRPRRCVYAPPPPAPFRRVVVRLRDAPPASLVAGHWGLPYLHEREGVGAPVRLEVRAGAGARVALEHRDGEGWARFALPLGAPGAAGLSFRLEGEGAEGRPICWEARLR